MVEGKEGGRVEGHVTVDLFRVIWGSGNVDASVFERGFSGQVTYEVVL